MCRLMYVYDHNSVYMVGHKPSTIASGHVSSRCFSCTTHHGDTWMAQNSVHLDCETAEHGCKPSLVTNSQMSSPRTCSTHDLVEEPTTQNFLFGVRDGGAWLQGRHGGKHDKSYWCCLDNVFAHTHSHRFRIVDGSSRRASRRGNDASW